MTPISAVFSGRHETKLIEACRDTQMSPQSLLEHLIDSGLPLPKPTDDDDASQGPFVEEAATPLAPGYTLGQQPPVYDDDSRYEPPTES